MVGFVDASFGNFVNIGRDQHNISNTYLVPQRYEPIQSTLGRLEPAPMLALDRFECLSGTRGGLIRLVDDWATDSSSDQNVFWLHGLAGSGKSTLSTTIANHLRETGRLGAFLFFNRDVTERSNPSNVVRTLAYQLGLFHSRIGCEIVAAMDENPSIGMSPLRLQFLKLLVEPLSSITPPETPLVVVLDALDECGTVKERDALLEILAEESPKLFPTLRIFVTSRAELDICNLFEDQPHICVHELDIMSDANSADILAYFRHRMSRIRKRKKHLSLGPDWPGESIVRELAARASGLFVWAFIASEFIDGHDPRRRLDILLKKQNIVGAEGALDALFTTALESAADWEDEDFVADFRAILGLVLAARHPISSVTVDRLLGSIEGRPSAHTISCLGCVMSLTPTIRILHPSFADFLQDRKRCQKDIWLIDPISSNQYLTSLCLDLLDQVLRRNICDLRLSEGEVNESLPEDVAYACTFWVEHICLFPNDLAAISERLDKFLHRHLLHWLEAMSILNLSRETITLLGRLSDWLNKYSLHRKCLLELVEDACRFVQAFADSIQQHTLLIYATALPFTPVRSHLYQTFTDNDLFPCIAGGFEQVWSPRLLRLSGNRGAIYSVAFSPDGRYIVSGAAEHNIDVWDSWSGAQILPSFKGHAAIVSWVTYSPDGKWIVSASDDRTICVWDAATGAPVNSLLHQQDGWTIAVALSPDGQHVISGSDDGSLCLRDLASGKVILSSQPCEKEPLSMAFCWHGANLVVLGFKDGTICIRNIITLAEVLPSWEAHEGPITTLSFSRNQTRIASGSQDTTVRVWDAGSGARMFPPLRGHRKPITVVEFSPDGSRIASGSDDKTIRLWSADSGDILSLFQGHVGGIMSVAFSPDGRRLTSGSFDTTIRIWDVTSDVLPTSNFQDREGGVVALNFSFDRSRVVSGSLRGQIRVWDAESGELILSPPKSHQGEISSVIFSPDGTRIASASHDMTIRIWDATLGKEISPPLRGHCDVVSSVSFSPDGQRIVSGSRDKTIRVWDATSGEVLVPPLRGHQDSIKSVGFSPNGKWIVSSSEDRTVRLWEVFLNTEKPPPPPFLHKSPLWTPGTFCHNMRRIISTSGDVILSWDDDTEKYVQNATISPGHDSGHAIFVRSDGWVVDLVSKRFFSKIPFMVLHETWQSAAMGNSLAIGLRGGRVCIMYFPNAAMASPLLKSPTCA